MIAKFYMKSGNVITVPDVKDAYITKGVCTITEWSITWKEGKRDVAFIYIPPSEIEAFIVLNEDEKVE